MALPLFFCSSVVGHPVVPPPWARPGSSYVNPSCLPLYVWICCKLCPDHFHSAFKAWLPLHEPSKDEFRACSLCPMSHSTSPLGGLVSGPTETPSGYNVCSFHVQNRAWPFRTFLMVWMNELLVSVPNWSWHPLSDTVNTGVPGLTRSLRRVSVEGTPWVILTQKSWGIRKDVHLDLSCR